jgi:hypothetical protein
VYKAIRTEDNTIERGVILYISDFTIGDFPVQEIPGSGDKRFSCTHVTAK